jgi:hypothetical protein
MRRIIMATAAAACTLAAAPAATACGVLLVPRLPDETEVELIARSERARQDELRAGADSVFLAQVSVARMVGDRDAVYTLTPFFPLYDTAQPGQAVTMHDSPMSNACEVEPELGGVYVVYAKREETGWRVTNLVKHGDFKDRPPGMPTARDVARGFYALPTYPE